MINFGVQSLALVLVFIPAKVILPVDDVPLVLLPLSRNLDYSLSQSSPYENLTDVF